MPARSSVLLTLPEDVRYELDARIIEHGFGGYRKHAAWLKSRGHAISESALQRYGRALKVQVSPEIYRLRRACARTAMLERTLREHDVELDDVLAVKIQELLHEALEDGADSERMSALQRASQTLHTTVRSQAAALRERRDAAERDPKRRDPKRPGLSPDGERAIRAAVEGPAQ